MEEQVIVDLEAESSNVKESANIVPSVITKTNPHASKKKVEVEKAEKDLDMDSIIESVLEELLSRCTTNTIDVNYQCGVCGKLFITENESENHIASDHEDPGCQPCMIYEKENTTLSENIEEKDNMFKKLVEKADNIVKKNFALDREIYRSKLALKESIVEKDEIRRELESYHETINEVIKRNATLNDELKVKNDLIEYLKDELKNKKESTETENKEKETEKETEKDAEAETETDNDSDKETDDDVTEFQDDRVKCNEYDFKSRVRKYLKSHMIAHHQGQYQCQRGCREQFKEWNSLDEHHKNQHGQPNSSEFKCDQCD